MIVTSSRPSTVGIMPKFKLLSQLCFFVLFFSIIGASNLYAQRSGQVIGQFLEVYATINGANYLEERCNVLSADLKKELIWHNNIINTIIRDVFKSKKRVLAKIRLSAKEVASSEKYADCDDKVKKIVMDRLVRARKLSYAFVNRAYDPKLSFASYLMVNLKQITAIIKYAEGCKFFPEKVTTTAGAILSRIEQTIEKKIGAQAMKEQREISPTIEKMKNAIGPCGERTKRTSALIFKSFKKLQYEAKLLGN